MYQGISVTENVCILKTECYHELSYKQLENIVTRIFMTCTVRANHTIVHETQQLESVQCDSIVTQEGMIYNRVRLTQNSLDLLNLHTLTPTSVKKITLNNYYSTTITR